MNIENFLIGEDIKLVDALDKIDKNGQGIVFICEDRRLKAVLSDGDIRRYILMKGDIEESVKKAANYALKSVKAGNAIDLKKYVRDNQITAVPIVNEDGIILEIYLKSGETIYASRQLDVPVVIMAGGKGTRLYPYTQILPKPLIPVGAKTITEHIIDRFKRFGCVDITMIVNYKKRFIETYFAEDSKYTVKFVEEEKYLGTGGGLKRLSGMTGTFFVTNCDILLEADYQEIYEYHKKHNYVITVVCARKKYEIPYGTVKKDEEGKLIELIEKPTYSFLANTGFYVMEPEFVTKIPDDTFVPITDTIEKWAKMNGKVGVYEVEESAWMDMGQMEELEKMRNRLEQNS